MNRICGPLGIKPWPISIWVQGAISIWELEASGCSMGASSLWLAATCLFHGMVQLLSLPLLPSIWEYLDCGDFVERTWKKETNTWLVMFSYDQGLLRSPFKAWLYSIAHSGHRMQNKVHRMLGVAQHDSWFVMEKGPFSDRCMQSSTLKTWHSADKCWLQLACAGMEESFHSLALKLWMCIIMLHIHCWRFRYSWTLRWIWKAPKNMNNTWLHLERRMIHPLLISGPWWYKVVPS